MPENRRVHVKNLLYDYGYSIGEYIAAQWGIEAFRKLILCSGDVQQGWV